MIIVIAKFPTINAGRDKDFIKWFEWSNYLLKKTPGLISRRLLQCKNGGYVAAVEFDSMDSFTILHQSDTHKKIHERTATIFHGNPIPEIYQLIDTGNEIISTCSDGSSNL
ncbi:MAG: antibiotic biosynthesis monooxygenase [Candidatus Nitrosocosmicus sp.]|jgi:heme-degrading monooxygenase HmoA|uniref:antibiotic biosynthesis monooxygenase family protein n=1 Tax=Candidatus Nitrosocosmicus agrestis TaxID=2563600 RepID=UPI00122DF14E|nr:antibiotic biosynthesis monooxygenase [Candidatus Nitrosocosmicus sp. SS]KAA2281395.1 antibiotic biosynthesis monooxygenase [Candidatus Nitrosocosmicus sp. SS]KAF0867595.1 antibiotic biosynthesis monooxygenase [Candidatus Nitrosocosmicus sp. SS]MDR4491692.1 antibiotic biosynthesis monooxygenase [Candidatus Nitrosocosmicus sp.]